MVGNLGRAKSILKKREKLQGKWGALESKSKGSKRKGWGWGWLKEPEEPLGRIEGWGVCGGWCGSMVFQSLKSIGKNSLKRIGLVNRRSQCLFTSW